MDHGCKLIDVKILIESDEERDNSSAQNAYEEERRARIARNNEALLATGLKLPTNILNAISARTKKSTTQAINVRPRSIMITRQEPPQLRKRNVPSNETVNAIDDFEAPSEQRRCTQNNNVEEEDINEDPNYDFCEDQHILGGEVETINAAGRAWLHANLT